MDINLKLLKSICEIPGAPGREEKIRHFIYKQIEDLIKQKKIQKNDVHVDSIGNLHVIKRGRYKNTKKIMSAAHLDEISFMVRHIDEQGFIRFTPLGGFDPKTLTAQRVIVHGKKDLIGLMGTKPIHIMDPADREKPVKISDFVVDVGLPKEEVEKIISIGDVITRERDLVEVGNYVSAKSLDNRIAVYILLETLRYLDTPAWDFYAVFTVQEEVGLRGAQVAAHTINPDFAINLDTTIAYDTPGAAEYEKCTQLGKGTAIKIMDSSVICDSRMIEFMKTTADKHNIPWQPEILVSGGTDTAPMQRAGKHGAIVGGISVPTRYIHSVIETVSKQDVLHSIQLLKHCIEEIHTFKF
ncbi:MAG: M42 family metallopeptidase [Bacteroidia bacterium]|nr:M42 family metallopeptidase [Bacteroidia bacterium]MDW8348217.1 M42 family metallopeptidase [Bacteroidia bacterium]